MRRCENRAGSSSAHGSAADDWRREIPVELNYDRDTVAQRNLVYGTAWKEDKTANVLYHAIRTGFRNIATAAQPKHYREDLVATAVEWVINKKIVTRDDLFVRTPSAVPDASCQLMENQIQTTFTPAFCQDPDNLAYVIDLDDPCTMDPARQCSASIRASQALFERHTRCRWLDAVILHEMYDSETTNDEVWESMNAACGAGRCRRIGVSNVTLDQLESLYRCRLPLSNSPSVKPTIVQNRFHRHNNFDADVRRFCLENGITYQAYGLLDGDNLAMLGDADTVVMVAIQLSVSTVAALYGLVMVALGPEGQPGNLMEGIQVMTGTKSHMKEDLEDVNNVMVALKDALLWKVVQDKRRASSNQDGGSSDPETPQSRLLEAMRSFRGAVGHDW